MWLKNNVLGVFFDECRGGMPVRDSFGFINAAAVEIAYTLPPPSFQSLNDKIPHIKKHSYTCLATSGIMRKGEKSTSHTYEMIATLEGNRLKLSCKLNVAKTEKIARSKIWLFTAKGSLQRCEVSGKILNEDLGGSSPPWDVLYYGEQLRSPVILSGPRGRLEILGATIPPVYSKILSHREYPKLEVVHGWARDSLLQKGTYSGNLTLTYGGR